MELTNRTILITGASSGMGRVLAQKLSEHSNRIIITARRKERLDALKSEIEKNNSECLSIAGDSCDENFAKSVIDQSIDRFGQIDIAVLNAGGGDQLNMAKTTFEEARDCFDINFKTHINYLFPLIDHMRDLSQAIIAHTNSLGSLFAVPGMGTYGAAKAASGYLMDVCRIELAKTPIKFISIYPGFVASNGPRNEIPVQAHALLVLDNDRAADEFMYALRKEKEEHIFPKRMGFPLRLLKRLPKSLMTFFLKKGNK